MIVALWTLNALLAVAFLGAGAPKVVLSKEAVVRTGQKGVTDLRPGAVRAIGVLEVLAAIGLILPLLLGIAPVLTPLAAVGLVLLMAGAAVVHRRRGETPAPNLLLAALAAISAVLGFGAVLA